MPTRRSITAGLSAAAATLLSSCGTIIYPGRVYQTERSQLDPAIVILDGIGLLFGIIPGLVAFAVDFTTGAIYFPADHEPGNQERTIFDQYEAEAKLDEREIGRIIALRTGKPIDLGNSGVRTMHIDSLDQFWMAHARLSSHAMLAAN